MQNNKSINPAALISTIRIKKRTLQQKNLCYDKEKIPLHYSERNEDLKELTTKKKKIKHLTEKTQAY